MSVRPRVLLCIVYVVRASVHVSICSRSGRAGREARELVPPCRGWSGGAYDWSLSERRAGGGGAWTDGWTYASSAGEGSGEARDRRARLGARGSRTSACGGLLLRCTLPDSRTGGPARR